MKIHNIRMGLATNSSSTHSLILMNPKDYAKLTTDEYSDFGWHYFTAADEKSKENYLGLVLRDNLARTVGDSISEVVLQGLFPHRDNFFEEIKEGYVDHQSCFYFPTEWDEKELNLEFFKEFRDYIVNQPIAILGGNDDYDGASGHKDWAKGEAIDFGFGEHLSGFVARKDEGHWVLFNRDNGTKLRISFDPKASPVLKAKTPELVDIKITNYCPFGCNFCYQASTTEGQHGDYSWIQAISYALGTMKVFEVAIGGGEPTLHPEFIRILETFRAYHIVPNFTTRNLAWLNDPDKAKKILTLCGAFAFSVSTRDEVQKLHEAMGKLDYIHDANYQEKVSVQFVLETGGDLYGVLDEAKKHRYRVTLLGFKKTGFGLDFPTLPEDWIEVVEKVRKENGYLALGVDTAIIQQYGASIKKRLGVKDELMTAEEGKFSMYIDAVEKKIAPSSYCKEDQYILYPSNVYDGGEFLTTQFAKF